MDTATILKKILTHIDVEIHALAEKGEEQFALHKQLGKDAVDVMHSNGRESAEFRAAYLNWVMSRPDNTVSNSLVYLHSLTTLIYILCEENDINLD